MPPRNAAFRALLALVALPAGPGCRIPSDLVAAGDAAPADGASADARSSSDAGDSAAPLDGGIPDVPLLRLPMNGADTGFGPSSLDPLFRWEPSTSPGGGSFIYQVEVAEDPAFTFVVATYGGLGALTYQTDLAVSATAPVGRRYWWRVRACDDSRCSAYSAPWYVDVGRSAHDVNGDGYADVLVGAPDRAVGGMAGAGGVDLFYGGGGAAFDDTPDLSVDGEGANHDYGNAVALCDVDADGYGDLVVGAQRAARGGAPATGSVYIHFGGPAPNTTVTWIDPTTSDSAFGAAVACGDVDADGYSDVVVGAPETNGLAGRVWVVWGAAQGMAGGFVYIDGAAGELLGASVSSGDLDGDGYAEIVAGAPGAIAGAGAVRISPGGARGDVGTTDWVDLVASSGVAGAAFGAALAANGDSNADGFADLLVGAPSEGEGVVREYRGSSGPLDGVADSETAGTTNLGGNSTAFGWGVAWADLDGDGRSDGLVLSPGAEPVGMERVTGYVYPGLDGVLGAIPRVLVGATADALGFGTIAGAGDVNGDGGAEVALGIPHGAVTDVGTVMLFFGGVGYDNVVDATLADPDPSGFGSALAALHRLAPIGPWTAPILLLSAGPWDRDGTAPL